MSWWGDKVSLDLVPELAAPGEVLAGEHFAAKAADWRHEVDEFILLGRDRADIGLRFVVVKHLLGELPLNGLALAALAGVSPATISRAIRDISEEIRQHGFAVRAAAKMKTGGPQMDTNRSK